MARKVLLLYSEQAPDVACDNRERKNLVQNSATLHIIRVFRRFSYNRKIYTGTFHFVA